MAYVADIADAVVLALNGRAFTQAFTAVRMYAPVFSLKDMQTLHVTVVPRGITFSRPARGIAGLELQVDIAVQKKLTVADNTEIDELMLLCQEIIDEMMIVGTFDDAQLVQTENVPIYAPDHILELRQFTSVITLTLRGMVQEAGGHWWWP